MGGSRRGGGVGQAGQPIQAGDVRGGGQGPAGPGAGRAVLDIGANQHWPGRPSWPVWRSQGDEGAHRGSTRGDRRASTRSRTTSRPQSTGLRRLRSTPTSVVQGAHQDTLEHAGRRGQVQGRTPRAWAARVSRHPAAPGAAPPPASRRVHLGPAARRRGGLHPAAPRPASCPSAMPPIMSAKSPRSCIIDPGEPFYIVDGRQRTDYEVELAIIMGPTGLPCSAGAGARLRLRVQPHAGTDRPRQRAPAGGLDVPGEQLVHGSIDRAAPFGPVIVPKEFLPNV